MLLLTLLACGGPTIEETADSGDCEGEVCALEVRDAAYTCDGETGARGELIATVRQGAIDVEHTDVQPGCCPTLTIEAVANPAKHTIAATYDFANDLCDCICMLGVTYTLVDPPSGSWTLTAAGQQTLVIVP
jgi:hypothetical protein